MFVCVSMYTVLLSPSGRLPSTTNTTAVHESFPTMFYRSDSEATFSHQQMAAALHVRTQMSVCESVERRITRTYTDECL